MTGEQLASIYFSIIFAAIVWAPIAWLSLSIFTPKPLLNKYFREPHFSLAETVLMAKFPGFLIRTGIFAWLALLPSLDKKRGLKNIKEDMPGWYRVSLQLFMLATLVSLLAIIILLPILILM